MKTKKELLRILVAGLSQSHNALARLLSQENKSFFTVGEQAAFEAMHNTVEAYKKTVQNISSIPRTWEE